MYPAVKSVQALSDYILILTFEGGIKKSFDMKPYLETGIFKELKDVQKFNCVHLSFDTVAWNNDADFDPEVLFQNGVTIV